MPSWFTVNVCPAIATVADLGDVEVFSATLYPTVPFPAPLVPLVIVIHALAVLAVQLQLPAAVTATVPLPPLDVYDALVADSV